MVYRIAIFIMGLFLVSAIAQPFSAVAAVGNYGLEDTAKSAHYKDDGTNTDIFNAVQRVVSVFLSLLGIIFFLLTTYAGIRWMSSRGNEEVSLEAKNTLESAVIGLVVVVSSYGITSFVFSKLDAAPPQDNAAVVPSGFSCAVLTRDECLQNANKCYWPRVVGATPTECKDKVLEEDEGGAGSPDWCVVVKNTKEMSCVAGGGSCSGTAQGFSQAEVDANFVCPFDGPSITTCPAFDQEHCERVDGCGWAGDTCAFKMTSASDDNGLVWPCNGKQNSAQCNYDSKCTAVSVDGRTGCIDKTTAAVCISESVNDVQDTCDPGLADCSQKCTKTLSDPTEGCYAECDHNISGGQITSCRAQCDVAKASCDDSCTVIRATCYAGYVAQKDDCLEAATGFYN